LCLLPAKAGLSGKDRSLGPNRLQNLLLPLDALKVGFAATRTHVAQGRGTVQVVEAGLKDHLLLIVRRGRLIAQVNRAGHDHVDATQLVYASGKALVPDPHPVIDGYPQVLLDGTHQQAGALPLAVLAPLSNPVGDCDYDKNTRPTTAKATR